MEPLNFVERGQGPMLVLSHALGLDLGMWDAVSALLEPRFTVLRYDHRGHGHSPAANQAFTIDDLADDAAALIRSRTDRPVFFVGISMGGMTAQALAVRAPELLAGIVIANSGAYYPDLAPWKARVERVLSQGVESIADGAVERWITPGFRATEAGSAMATQLRATLIGTDAVSYAAACDAVAGIDYRESNRRIGVPTLVIAGTLDLATPASMSEDIAAAIPGAQLKTIEAAHISSVERPAELAALIESFVNQA
ncbi:alpha/beta fold hydrolase [Xylophilus sp. Kf1]|nr:alpha/beta fold hydrolase [Xylophilus sp. Kf1]